MRINIVFFFYMPCSMADHGSSQHPNLFSSKQYLSLPFPVMQYFSLAISMSSECQIHQALSSLCILEIFTLSDLLYLLIFLKTFSLFILSIFL